MRIVGGKLRGRRLVSFDAAHIRPTTDRVKESIFNKLQAYWEEARVLDLFSGTGNLSIEAWSRGAREVTAVELNRKSLHIIEKNIEELEIHDGFILKSMDVFKYLREYEGPAYDIILADPPFTEKLGHSILESMENSQVMGPESILVLEVHSKERIEKSYSNLECFDDRDYGDKRVLFYRRPQP